MTLPVFTHASALRDVESAALHLATEASIEAAERFVRAFEKTLELLGGFPRIGHSWPSEDPRLVDLRTLPMLDFRLHLVFYRPALDRVEVLRVLHARRDLPSILEAELEATE